jgi:hypothetical protein
VESLKIKGTAPAFKKSSVGMAADYIAVRETEHRLEAAQVAVEKLAAEVSAATVAHDAAKTAVGNEAREILAREAEEHAEQIARLEGEAYEHRIRLEGASRSAVFGYRPLALSDLCQRILRENNSLSLSTRNEEPWCQANASAEFWRQRHANLVNNA